MTSVLFLNRVFPPETGAAGHCLAEAAERVAAAGLDVRVVVDGDGPIDAPPGVNVRRTGRRLSDGGRPRVRDHLAALARVTATATLGPRRDVVVSMTDPPFLGLGGLIVARMWGAASVHWCQDVHPRLTRLIGRNPPRLADSLADRALRRHERVIAIDPDMERFLVGRAGVAADRVRLIPNWADPLIRPLPPGGGLSRRELGLEGRLVVLHAGNLGLTHPVSVPIDAARRLSRTAPDVLFVVAGGGRRRVEMERAVRAARLDNFLFLDRFGGERISDLMALGDIHLALLDPRAVGLMSPRKLTSGPAAGRPTLLVGPPDCHAARVLRETGTGASADDGEELAAEILIRRNDPELRRTEGLRARSLARNWTADDAARALIETLDDASRRRRVR